MLTGGQLRSFGLSVTAGGGAPSAGAGSSDFPPKRLLKRSLRDCDDAGEASMLQLIPNAMAADIAILPRLPGRAAVTIPHLSVIRGPWHSLGHLTVVPRAGLYL